MELVRFLIPASAGSLCAVSAAKAVTTPKAAVVNNVIAVAAAPNGVAVRAAVKAVIMGVIALTMDIPAIAAVNALTDTTSPANTAESPGQTSSSSVSPDTAVVAPLAIFASSGVNCSPTASFSPSMAEFSSVTCPA